MVPRLAQKIAGAAALALLAMGVAAPSAPAQTLAPISASLSGLLGTAADALPMAVLVHGRDLATADAAVRQAGLTKLTTFRRINTVAATGTAGQVRAARAVPGVTYVENNDPIRLFASSGTTATRSLAAQQTLVGANGTKLDGTGVSIATIDSGIDPTHPAFKGADGNTRVVRSLKGVCLTEDDPTTSCLLDVPTFVDTDLLAVGGHGTHVNGIAAGNNYTLADGTKVGGSAPGAKIVSLSVGAALLIIGADSALNWVLENHAHPCGADVPASTCPPIKAINNSYGPSGGGAFDANSATVQLQPSWPRRAWSPCGPTATTAATAPRACPTRRAWTRRRASCPSPRSTTRAPVPATARCRTSPRAARRATRPPGRTSPRRARTSPPRAGSTCRSAPPACSR